MILQRYQQQDSMEGSAELAPNAPGQAQACRRRLANLLNK